MTAEVIVMNKQGVALAADSAVTYGAKVYYSANKVFALSKVNPVGIMIYGNASLMGVPWEIIIKQYRDALDNKSFNTLSDYSLNFIKYLEKSAYYFPEDNQIDYMNEAINSFFNILNHGISKEVNNIIESKGKIGKRTIKQIIKNEILSKYNSWKNEENLGDKGNKDFSLYIEKYQELINTNIFNNFKNDLLSQDLIKKLRMLCAFIFLKKRMRQSVTSGIVISGYGDSDIFPSYSQFRIEAFVDNKLKFVLDRETKIALDNDAVIVPFAQSEMVSRFIDGIDPELELFTSNYFENILNGYHELILDKLPLAPGVSRKEIAKRVKEASMELFKKYQEDLDNYKYTSNISPIISMVGVLPKDELASMAEALVNLTSFKRKVSDESETVGGPIDVAVISKGDGLIWIKRKHYFNPELNHGFFKNYYRGIDNGKNED